MTMEFFEAWAHNICARNNIQTYPSCECHTISEQLYADTLKWGING
jgi:hypothetical protein